MVAAGLILIAVTQAVSPVVAPLFDGLTVLGPYRYVEPAPGQPGSPTSATVTESLVNGASPGFNAATGESPPQAQLIAAPGAFALVPGSTSVTVTIRPIRAPAESTVGPILGNVYRFAVTDQAGSPLATRPGTDVTLVLRAPDAASEAVFAQYTGGTWVQLASSPSGTPAFFIAMTGGSGDFALVAAAGSGLGFGQAAALAIVVTAILAGAGLLLIRRRRRPEPRGRPAVARRGPADLPAGRGKRKRR